MDPIAKFEKMLAAGRDNALLRFSLGNARFTQGDAGGAVTHLRRAVEFDPDYSAAWKLLGRALAQAGDAAAAIGAFEHGIRVATARGDIQAAKEMRVFLRRLRQKHPPG